MVEKRAELTFKAVLPNALQNLINNLSQFIAELVNQLPSNIEIKNAYVEGSKLIIIYDDLSETAGVTVTALPLLIVIIAAITILVAWGILVYNTRVYNIEKKRLEYSANTCQAMIDAGLVSTPEFKEMCTKTFGPEGKPDDIFTMIEKYAGYFILAFGAILLLQAYQASK